MIIISLNSNANKEMFFGFFLMFLAFFKEIIFGHNVTSVICRSKTIQQWALEGDFLI
jgi:hypothetical protein